MSKVRTTITISEEALHKIDKIAEEQDRSRSYILEKLFMSAMDDLERKKGPSSLAEPASKYRAARKQSKKAKSRSSK
ncbi:MAG: ribbon-helix-helix protein, CopG family [Verrucomicrobiota bacterium]